MHQHQTTCNPVHLDAITLMFSQSPDWNTLNTEWTCRQKGEGQVIQTGTIRQSRRASLVAASVTGLISTQTCLRGHGKLVCLNRGIVCFIYALVISVGWRKVWLKPRLKVKAHSSTLANSSDNSVMTKVIFKLRKPQRINWVSKHEWTLHFLIDYSALCSNTGSNTALLSVIM